MNWRERVVAWVANSLAVTAVPVGRTGDGLTEVFGPVNRIDKPWAEQAAELEDAREAWRKNPLARRLVGLTTSYTVGNGITLHSEDRRLDAFLREFWVKNRMDLRVDEWSDELSRSGELFPVLFTNPVDGMSTVRTVPACLIAEVEVDPEDYEQELRYREVARLGGPVEGTWWQGEGMPDADSPAQPLMLHYAINRPVGAVRGESDLAPLLPWLRRYSRWLEDRVRLNAAMRAFLWIVNAPARLRATLEERYRQPPEAGSVIIAEKDAETWTAVAPNLHAADAEKDGRAIRWMIVAGGPGTALLDIGEGEDSNLATGQAMAEQRRRFLRRRQAYLGYLLVDLVLHAYARYCRVRKVRTRALSPLDVQVSMPDISPEDNQSLAGAAGALTGALGQLATITGTGPAYRRMALRLFSKFVGESLDEAEAAAILAEGERALSQAAEQVEQNTSPAPQPLRGSGSRSPEGEGAGQR